MSRWKRISHALEFAGVRFALAIASLFPLGPSRVFGAALGWLAFSVFGVRRDVAVNNVERSLGVDTTEANRVVRRSYENLGRTLIEFVAMRRMTPDDVRRIVRLEGLENIEAALSEGRGAVYIGGHLGNWELLGAALVAAGVPLSFLVGQQTNARVDHLMNDLRAGQGIGIIPRAMALKNVLRRLRANEVVAMLSDQDAGRDGVFVDFLGAPASTARGPALFAIRQGCPLVFGFMHRDSTGMLVGTTHAPIWPTPGVEEEESVRDLTQRYTDALTHAVRRHANEYFWGHRRWKTKEL